MDTNPGKFVGQRLGDYELLELIGSGGFGEVYRARTTGDNREVAVKVVRSAGAGRHELHRFKQEAKTLRLLNHPHIVTIYDVGVHDDNSYIVTELLEGETLRARLQRGPLAARTAVLLAIQVAEGLAAAHEQGIVHRDLKPENLFIAADDHVKILDFDLAKLVPLTGDALVKWSTVTPTGPGVLIGTLGYMAPEQINDTPQTDRRSDIFSLGVILYEMLSGLRPFQRNSPAETVAAVLHVTPPDLTLLQRDLPPALGHVVRACLQKQKTARFDTAADVARALRGVLSELDRGRSMIRGRRWRPASLIAAGVALFGSGVLVAAAVRPLVEDAAHFARVTFGRGPVFSARFSPEGRVLYEAAFNGASSELFTTVPGTAESRSLGRPGAGVLSISPSGKLAMSFDRRTVHGYMRVGTLAVSAIDGGGARTLLDSVYWAEWKPHTNDLVVVRDVAGRVRLEILGGKVLHETSGWLGEPRFSPDGRLLAVTEYKRMADAVGAIVLIDAQAPVRTLTSEWLSLLGIAWSPRGDEIFFTAKGPDGSALRAVDLSGRVRVVRRGPGTLRLHDIAPDGRVLLARDDVRLEALGRGQDDAQERLLSWLDWTLPRDLSADGSTLLFTETGEAAGREPGVYVRDLRTSAVTRLGAGSALAFSPDGTRVLAIADSRLVLQDTKSEARTVLGGDGFVHNPWASFFPDGKRIAFAGIEPPRGSRVFIRSIDANDTSPVTPEGYRLSSANAVSPDGRLIAAIGPKDRIYLCSSDGGAQRPLEGSKPGELVAGWHPSGRAVFVFTPSQLPITVYQQSLAGERHVWRTFAPADRIGTVTVHRVVLSADGRSYAYALERQFSDLYIVTGLIRP